MLGVEIAFAEQVKLVEVARDRYETVKYSNREEKCYWC